MLVSLWLAERLAASPEGLRSMDLFRCSVVYLFPVVFLVAATDPIEIPMDVMEYTVCS
jgi:hypothetical protein